MYLKLAKEIVFEIIQPHYSWRRKCSRSRISTFAILRINEMSQYYYHFTVLYTETVYTPFENAQRWMGKNTFPILLLNDDNMIGEHQETRMKMPNMCPFEKIENLLNNFRKKNFKHFRITLKFFCLAIHKKLKKSCSLYNFFLFLKKKVVSLKKTFFSKGHIFGIFILVSQCSPIMLSSFQSKIAHPSLNIFEWCVVGAQPV